MWLEHLHRANHDFAASDLHRQLQSADGGENHAVAEVSGQRLARNDVVLKTQNR